MVEVTFTVTPRTRRIAAHAPNDLPALQFYRQLFWSSGIDMPEDGFEKVIGEITLELVELPPGEKAMLSLTLPAEFVIVFDPGTHTALFIIVNRDAKPHAPSLSMDFKHAT